MAVRSDDKEVDLLLACDVGTMARFFPTIPRVLTPFTASLP